MDSLELKRSSSSAARSNLAVLKQIDERISKLLSSAKHVVMYKFNCERGVWVRSRETFLVVVERIRTTPRRVGPVVTGKYGR